MEKIKISNSAWKVIENLSVKMIQLVVMLYMTRKLMPTDVGIMSIALLIVSFSEIFLSSGLYSALVQKQNPDRKDFSTALWFSFSMGVLLYVIAFGLSGRIAEFYDIAVLKPVIRVLLLVVPSYAVLSIINAYAAKKFKFKQMFVCNFIATVTSGIFGIVLVTLKPDVWALVYYNMFYNFAMLILMYIISKPKILGGFYPVKLRGFVKVGLGTLGSSMIAFVSDSVYSAVIGKKINVVELGYYNKGSQVASTLPNAFNTAICSVMLPTFSQYQDDKVKVKEQCRSSLRFYNYIYYPIILGIVACAPKFVSVVLTDKWNPIVSVLQILCISYCTIPYLQITSQAYLAMGYVKIRINLELIKMALVISLLFASLGFGINAVALSRVIAVFMVSIIGAGISKKILNYSFKEQLQDTLKPLLITVFMMLCVMAAGYIPVNDVIGLIIQIIIGVCIYVIILYILKVPEFTKICEMIGLKRKHE